MGVGGDNSAVLQPSAAAGRLLLRESHHVVYYNGSQLVESKDLHFFLYCQVITDFFYTTLKYIIYNSSNTTQFRDATHQFRNVKLYHIVIRVD